MSDLEYINEKLEEFNRYLKNRKVAIIGLGVSNLPLLDYLQEVGANITVFDHREEKEFSSQALQKMIQLGIEYHLGKNSLEFLVGFDIIFRSPSCRPDVPEIAAEIERGAILTTEIEMVMKLCPGTVIGITGSDGKTTTTTLIYQMIKEKGYTCYLGGNIGIPLFCEIPKMKPQDVVVLELSSFQLMDMEVSPQIAVITNISPNHLDIHKSFEEYVNAKKNIFRYQSEKDLLVLNEDNEITKNFAKEAKGKVTMFSSKSKLDNGIILDDEVIKKCEDRLRKHIIKTSDIVIRGEHNYQNACAAIAATQYLIDTEAITKVLTTFKGVECRLELVEERKGAKWYNDSSSSSPTRTIAGIKAFTEPMILIAGGYDKHLDYTPIAEPIVDKVKALVLLGQTSQKIQECVQKEIEQRGKQLPIYPCASLEQAVQTAYQISQKGDVVLFSPASASFDMFKNFKQRGDVFKQLVEELPN